ncbi:hypothetical protein [Microcystis phage Mae-JY24]
MIPNNYKMLEEYALEVLSGVDFAKSPQLNLAWAKVVDGIAEMVAEKAINLPLENWVEADNA